MGGGQYCGNGIADPGEGLGGVTVGLFVAGFDGVPNTVDDLAIAYTTTDANGNYVPDCVLTNPAANGECGPWSDLNFGRPTVGTKYSANALRPAASRR